MSDAFSFTAGISLDLEQFKRDLDKAAAYAYAAFSNLRLGLDGLSGVDAAFKKAWPKGTVLDMYENPVRNVSKAVKNVEEEFESAGRAAGGLTDAFTESTKKTKATAKMLSGAQGGPIEVKQSESLFRQASLNLPAFSFVANALKAPLKAAFDNFAGRESLAINLGTLLGDDERGAAFQKRLQDYAAHTPYAQNDLAGTAQTLLQYGATEDDAETYLRQLGDIAMGDRNKFSSLGLALGQVQSVGRLQGQDLLQMINAGFNPLSVIAEETGRSMAELKDAMSKGEIGFDQVAMALRKATEEGGKFYKGAERGSKTFQGLISTITDNFSIALGTAVENNQGGLRAVLETWANFDWSTFIEGVSGVFKYFSDGAVMLSGIAATLSRNAFAIELAANGMKILAGVAASFAALKFASIAKEIGLFISEMGNVELSFKSLRGNMSAVATAAGTVTWAIYEVLQAFRAWQQLKGQEGKKADRELAESEMKSSYGRVKKAYNKYISSKELYGDKNEWTKFNLKEFKRLNEEHEKALKGWTSRGSSGISINANMKTAAGIKDEVMKAVSKDTKLANVYAPTTNNVTQNNNISTDFNDIGKLVRENLIEILKSQLTFRRDREAIAGAGA